jgi:hypothetical protein
MNKSYNPFKMWGSYVGAIISFLLMNWIFEYSLNKGDWMTKMQLEGAGPVQHLIAPLIVGFLVGWGIHSLIRKIIK